MYNSSVADKGDLARAKAVVNIRKSDLLLVEYNIKQLEQNLSNLIPELNDKELKIDFSTYEQTKNKIKSCLNSIGLNNDVPFNLTSYSTILGYKDKRIKEDLKSLKRYSGPDIKLDMSATSLGFGDINKDSIEDMTNVERRDYAAVLGDGDINLKVTKHALNQLEIDELGLDETDRKILEIMINQYQGRPVGLECKENIQSEKKVSLTNQDIEAYNTKLETYNTHVNSGAFLYIGRLVSTKGVKQIILAWYKLYSENNFIPPLWIVGGSHKEIEIIRNELSNEIPQLPLLEKSMQICFWGYLPFDIINVLLLRSLVLIEHSRFEAGGRVILEAMSTGTPVIATPFGFAKDLIKNWENGFLVNYNDINQLSLCMSFFIQQPHISKALGMHAYETYLHYKKVWNYAQRHLEIYNAYFFKEKIYITDTPKSPMISNYFQKGMIIKYTTKEREKLVFQFCKENNICITKEISEHTNGNGKSFLWELESYYIKHLYPVLNSALLWNPAVETQILDSELKMKKCV